MRLLPATTASRARAPEALGAALAIVLAYAAFAGGATDLPAEARLQVTIALAGLGALAGLVLGPRLRVSAPPLAWAGVALLAGFAAWSGITLGWSRAPDATWIELNRAVSYALAPALGLVLGSSLARAAERSALAYLAVAAAVALWALAGKALPWLHDGTGDFSRLREPLGYWNALALFCAMAVPAALRLAADDQRAPRLRLAGQLALVPLLVTISLTYSRGGFVALAVVLAVTIAAGPGRLRLAAIAAPGAAGAAPALLVAFLRDDLTTDGLSVSDRTGAGLMLLAALLAGCAVATLLGARLIAAGRSIELGERARRVVPRTLAAAAVACVAGLVIGLSISDRGLGGTVSQEWDDFTAVKFERQDDPGRILRTSSGNRWVWWGEAADAWRDRPLSGHGAGSFALLHLLHRDNALEVRDAHSVPLELLAETGVVGTLLALGGVGLLGAAALRGARGSPYGAALGAAVAAWAVHLWIDWDWDIPALTLPALVFLGVLAARPPGQPKRRPPRVTGLALGALLAAAIVGSALLPSLARDRTDEALAQAARGTPAALERGADDGASAADLDPLAIEPLLAGARIAERRGQYAREAELLADAVERQPDNPRAWLALARFDFLIGDRRATAAAARRALTLDPRNGELRALIERTEP
jgi:hypothetical protein